MNPEIKKMWTDALESGEYQQGRYVLKNGDAFCCLGVLCDLHRKATNGPDWKKFRLSNELSNKYRYLHEPAHLPTAVLAWAELSHSVPSVQINAQPVYLSNLNDNGTPFSLIAEHIKRQL